MRALLDHLIRPCQHVGRNCETDLLGGFEADNQLEFRRLFDRQIGGLCSLQDFVHVSGGAAVEIGQIHAVEHETASLHVLWSRVNCREPILTHILQNTCYLSIEDGAPKYDESFSTLVACGPECSLDILGSKHIQRLKLHTQWTCRKSDLS